MISAQWSAAILGAALWLSAFGPAPAGAEARLTIHKNALEKYADHLGTVSGTGQHALSGLAGEYEWELSNFAFAIDGNGIRFEADMTARWPVGSFNVLSYTSTVNGTAEIEMSAQEVRLSVPSVSFPLVFDIPFVGPVTLLTITAQLPFRFTAPVQPILLPGLSIVAAPLQADVDYLQNRVRLSITVVMAQQ